MIVDGMTKVHDMSYTEFVVQTINNYTTGDSTAYISAVYALIAAVMALIIFKSKFRLEKSTFRGKSKNLPMTITGAVLFTIAMQYVTTYLVNALSAAVPSWLEEYEELIEAAGIDTSMSLVMSIYVLVLGPVCEELLFRGVTFFAAKKVMPVYFAILVQAIMFGSYHMNKLQGIYAFVLGLGLGYIMYLYDNLWITILIHVAYNFLGTYGTEYLPLAGDSIVSFFISTLSALVAVYGSIILLKNGATSVKNDGFSVDI